MRLFQGTRSDLTDTLEIGSGLTLAQNATGVPIITGGSGSLSDGTEALPGLAWTSDPDTGFYHPAASPNVFRAVVNGSWVQEWATDAIRLRVPLQTTSATTGAPTFTTFSGGVRASWFPSSIGAADVSHSIGVETGAVWYAAGSVTNSHKWYGGETEWMRLYVEGMNNAKLVINPGITPTISDTPTKGMSVRISSNDTGTIHHLGGLFYAEQTAATVQSIQGVEGYTVTRNTSGAVELSAGAIGNVDHNGAGGSLTFGTGIRGGVTVRAGTITEGAAIYAQAPAIIGGSIGTAYGLYIVAQAGASTNYQIYSAGTALSMFLGPIEGTILRSTGLGSVSAPTHTFASSTNTGLYAPATGQVALTANGTQVFVGTTSVNIPVSFQIGGGTLISTSTVIAITNGSSSITGAWTISGAWSVSGTWGMGGAWTVDTNGNAFKFSEIQTAGVLFETAQSVDADAIKVVNTNSGPGLYAIENNYTKRWRFGMDGSGAGNKFSFFAYDDSGALFATVMQFARSGNDPVSIYVNGALKQITVDAVDTAGSGFRALRVPN